jgi:hypothetical protein
MPPVSAVPRPAMMGPQPDRPASPPHRHSSLPPCPYRPRRRQSTRPGPHRDHA